MPMQAGWVYGQGIDPKGWSGGKLITLSEVQGGSLAGDDARMGRGAASTGDAEGAPRLFPRSTTSNLSRGDATARMASGPDAHAGLDRRRAALAPGRGSRARRRLLPVSTRGSSRSTRSSTGTGALAASSSISSWCASATPRRSSTKATGVDYLAALRRADQGDLGASRRVPGPGDPRQPLQVRRPRDRRSRPAGSTTGAGDRRALGERVDGLPRPRPARRPRRHADGTWRSSAVWVEEYEASRYKRE